MYYLSKECATNRGYSNVFVKYVFYFTSEVDIIYISRVANEPARVRSSDKGTGLSPNFVPAEPSPVVSPNSEPARVRRSEKGTGLSPNSDLPNQGLARCFLRTPNLPNQGSALSFHQISNLPNQGSARSFLRTSGLSEKKTGLSLNSQPAVPGLYPVPSPNLTMVNSVHLRTPN